MAGACNCPACLGRLGAINAPFGLIQQFAAVFERLPEHAAGPGSEVIELGANSREKAIVMAGTLHQSRDLEYSNVFRLIELRRRDCGACTVVWAAEGKFEWREVVL